MCGDSGNPEHVARLFGDVRPDLVFTSPPYAQQRTYVSGIGDWDVLMQRVFGAMPCHEKTQVLVNLGLVHRKGEWVPYWDGWIDWMRTQGWRRFGWYVWDKLYAVPTGERGRLQGCHEWIFHFNKVRRIANRTMPTARIRKLSKTARRKPDGQCSKMSHAGRMTNPTKIADSVVRMWPEQSRGAHTAAHPAVFPVALPVEIMRAYTDPGEVVFDPFAGSGTSILAAEKEGRTAYAMEIEPSYCAIAVDRFLAVQPSLPGAA